MKKEKLEDITPFVPHIVIEKNQEKERAKTQTAKEILEDYKRAKKQRNGLAIALTVIFCIIAIYFVGQIIQHTENMYANGLSSCLNDGYSKVYCETHNVR